jgi:hypothetical protein
VLEIWDSNSFTVFGVRTGYGPKHLLLLSYTFIAGFWLLGSRHVLSMLLLLHWTMTTPTTALLLAVK